MIDERLKHMCEVLLWEEKIEPGSVVIVRDSWEDRCFRMRYCRIGDRAVLAAEPDEEWPDRREGVKVIAPTPALHYYVPPGGTNEE